ncbi:MAG TPA: hypothetical protein VGG13_01890 [Candidatus Saccharimonadales bacterium]|jgi:uncharacterized membrane protein
MNAILLTLVAATVYAGFAIFARLAGDNVNSWLASILYNGIGTVVPLVVYLALNAKGKTSMRGVVFASLAGVCIMLFSVLLARIFTRGGNLGYVIPTVYGGAILLSTIYGWLFLKDKVGGLQLVGLVLLTAGIVLQVVAKVRTA